MTEAAQAGRSPRPRLVLAAAVSSVLLLLGGVAIGRLTSPLPPQTPVTTSAEAGFARDMQKHHLQAVEMAMIVRESSGDPAVLGLAYDIATAQGQQAGQMFGWLSVWGLPQAASEPSMTWMTRPPLDGAAHGHGTASHMPGEPMPGFATSEQLDALENATGAVADSLFLELMIAHHEGGVEMAEAILDRSTNDVVASLAQGTIVVQDSEIDYMNELLARTD
ncbi:MAG: hypothetical protein JWL94_2097 [Microbacteriaceae bacterium]|jgi:uncharacterized protein (DUF305 family)|nr:hypothetical protein [Microbacteriaceae bacterium]HEV7956144.1 DUF305 domain-containing protein [Marisediminicola sp.]